MRDQLEALEELARIDLGFRQLDVAQDEINTHLADLRSDVERIRDLLEREKVQLGETEQLEEEFRLRARSRTSPSEQRGRRTGTTWRRTIASARRRNARWKFCGESAKSVWRRSPNSTTS